MTMCTRDVSRSIIFPLPSSPHCRPTTATTAIISSPFIRTDYLSLQEGRGAVKLAPLRRRRRGEREQPLDFRALVESRNRRVHTVNNVGKGKAFGGAGRD